MAENLQPAGANALSRPREFAPRKRARQKSNSAPWDAAVEIAKRRLNRFVTLAPKVIQGDDPDAIHDFRVASRRLQQILDLFYPKPYSKKVRKLRRVIRRSRRCLSTVRNCDALMERAAALKRKSTRQNESWQTFEDYLSNQRSKSFAEAVPKLRKLNPADFYLRVQDSLKDLAHSPSEPPPADSALPGVPAEIGAAPVERFLDRIECALRARWEEFDAQVESCAADGRQTSLHAVRIEAKRFRYLAEVAHDLGLAGIAPVLVFLRRLQHRLGEWHDLEVMEEMMAQMVARPKFLRANIGLAINIEKLMLRNQRLKRASERKYRKIIADSGARSRMKAWANKPTSADPAN